MFQFPTGWNSTQGCRSYRRLSRCFNSQRDGILRCGNGNSIVVNAAFQFPTGWNSTQIFIIQRLFCRAFQFPTGWNSTKLLLLLDRKRSFQFPTGWNSTKAQILDAASRASFNSQRDGILLYSLHKLAVLASSFNSQRDGILLASISAFLVSISFQFPTGWNSTFASLSISFSRISFQFPTGWNSTYKATYRQHQKFVSIPNGMEFYTDDINEAQAWFSFNSQRDGILPSLISFQAVRNILVSIPNGMEFYLADSGFLNPSLTFQFPTGWNSTSSFKLSCVDIHMFQFPTGWNSTRPLSGGIL